MSRVGYRSGQSELNLNATTIATVPEVLEVNVEREYIALRVFGEEKMSISKHGWLSL